MHIWISLVFGLLTFWGAPRVRAQVAVPVVLRAVLPNPTGSDSQEWIDLENVSGATVAAQLVVLADTEGSVTRYQLEADLQPHELRRLTATQSGITLNNSKEQVELWWNGERFSSSPVMTEADEDQVWVQLDDGWQTMVVADYDQRRADRQWGELAGEMVSPVPTASPSPHTLSSDRSSSVTNRPLGVTSPSTTTKPDHQELPSASSSAVAYHTLRMPELRSLTASAAAPLTPRLSELSPPRPEQAEVDRYQWWKRRAVGGSLLMLWGGATLSLLSWPPLWRWWLIHGY